MQLHLQSQKVSNLISQLEEARASGILGAILNQVEISSSTSQIVALYTSFANQPHLKPRFHEEHTQAITREALRPLRKPAIIFPATLRKLQRVDKDTGECVDEWKITRVETNGFILRPDQALSARYWGIGFDLGSDEDNYLLEDYLLGLSVNRLVQMLRDFELVEAEFDRKRYECLYILPSRRGADFEQLLLDVLNEHDHRARHAPLVEDLLEKTDLRVHVPGVHRRRGARVQITAMIDPLFYQSKLATIDRLEELVLLSPASIARFVRDTGKALESGIALLKEQAIQIRNSLFTAVESRHKSPLGPLTRVPENLRTIIREFIDVEVVRSTNALRDRELQRGTICPRSKYIRARRTRFLNLSGKHSEINAVTIAG